MTGIDAPLKKIAYQRAMPLPVKIAEHFYGQAKGSEDLGSPFMGLLCRLLADRLDPAASRLGSAIAGWPGDPRLDALSLRVVGGLHAVARSGRVVPLTAAYPPHAVATGTLWPAVVAAIAAEDDFLTGYLESPPQTNEVARSSAVLGGCLLISRETGLPLEILEIGSSAGLNLGFDQYRYELGCGTWGFAQSPVAIVSRWEGPPPPLSQPVTVVARAGCDRRPLDPRSAADRAKLMSYIWPDQAARLTRTEAALSVAGKAPWRVAKADAAEWLRQSLATPQGRGVARVVLHTIVWQYLPAETRSRIKRSIEQAGAAASMVSPLAWLIMENDEIDGSAGLRLRLWPGGASRYLGRADFHGRWVRWENGAG